MTRAIKTQTKRFMITKIEPDLWRKFKTACAFYDLSMRQLFINLMTNIVNDYENRPWDNYPPILKYKHGPEKKCLI